MPESSKLYKYDDPVYYTCYRETTRREINEPFHRIIHILDGTFHVAVRGKEYSAGMGDYMLMTKGNRARIKMIPSHRSGYFKLICVNLCDNAIKRYFEQNTFPQNYHPIPPPCKKITP